MAWSYRVQVDAAPARPDPAAAEQQAPPPPGRRDRPWQWRDLWFWCGMFALTILGGAILRAFTTLPAAPTTQVALQGNLDSDAPIGATIRSLVPIVDHQGRRHQLVLAFQKQAADSWHLTAFVRASAGQVTSGQPLGVLFRPDGSFHAVTRQPPALTIQFNAPGEPLTVHFDFGTPGKFDGLTQVPQGLPHPPHRSLLAAAY